MIAIRWDNFCRNKCLCTNNLSLSSFLAACVICRRGFYDVLMILWHVRLHRSPLFGCHAMPCVIFRPTLYHLTGECKTTSVFTQNRPMAVVLSSQNSKKRSRSLMWITARPSRQMNCYSSWRTSEWWPPRTRSRTCCRRWTRMVSYREMRKDREWGNRITNIEWSSNFLLFSPAFLSFFRSSIC